MDSDQLYTWPYKDLVGERISHIEETHTFAESHTQLLEDQGHNSHRRQGSALRASHCGSLQHQCVCTVTSRVA